MVCPKRSAIAKVPRPAEPFVWFVHSNTAIQLFARATLRYKDAKRIRGVSPWL